MDQLSEAYYRDQALREEVAKSIEDSKMLSPEQKVRWKVMLKILTKRHLQELDSLLIRQNQKNPHPKDFIHYETKSLKSA